ncbi:MAG: metallophosphoesterase [Clostridia bacterium]|nr:metallophosphoesterase [Clostridia bacterium]
MFWIWFWSVSGVIALSVLIFFLIWGSCFRVSEHTVKIANLPKEFDSYRIALISDLHDRSFGKNNSRLANAILNTNPDLVVTAGDLHEDPHSPEPVYALFSALSSVVPVTYTEGNHDMRQGRCGVSAEAYQGHLSRLTQAGAVLLNDAFYPLERNGKQILLYGQSWRGMRQGILPDLDVTLPTVVVCHDPLQFDKIRPLPDLMLTGHVHGGILRLPFIGPVFAPGNGLPLLKRFGRRFFFPKYSRGLYYNGKHTLAVTQGVGFFALPIRFIRPEIMVLVLKSDEKLNNS